MSSVPVDRDQWMAAAAAAIRLSLGVIVVAMGVAVGLGFPFESVVHDPSLASGPWLLLSLWLIVIGAGFATTAFVPAWRKWPLSRPRLRLARWALAIVVGILLPIAATVGGLLLTAVESNVGKLAFTNELHIPELLEPITESDGQVVFEIQAQHGERSFKPGTVTETIGVNGDYLGPTIRASTGDDVQVRVTNALDEVTTMHWHGMRLPASEDGGPHHVIAPGWTWNAEWTVDQPAATLWYHPHVHRETGSQIYRGLTGLFIIDDEVSGSLDIPDDYGVDDIPLIVQDRRFDENGQFIKRASHLSSLGALGNEILVNGTYDPYLIVEHELVRFRILNGSNDRVYNFGFVDERAFWQIGTDGGLLEQPYETDRIMLSPGERAEIVVQFEPGDDVILRSFPPQTGSVPERRVGGSDTFDILRIIADEDLMHSPPLPDRLTTIAPLVEEDREADRHFVFGDETINGQQFDMTRVDEVVSAGTVEVWEVENADSDPHNFHPHDVQVQVISVDGEPPPPELSGWKDTVYIRPDSSVRMAIRFGDHPDPEYPFMYHCHFLTHEDHGMMGQFTVVEPDDVDTAPRTLAVPGEHQH